MRSKKVIDRNNLPTKLPLGSTLLLFLMLDIYKAPEWLWGVCGLAVIIIWASSIYLIFTQKEIDLLEDDEKSESDEVKKSGFQDRLNQMKGSN